MTKADLIALAERVERANPAQQAELIADAWDMLGPIRLWTAEQAARFAKMLDAEAYESAAILLVPEGADTGGERYKFEQWNDSGVFRPHIRASCWIAGAARTYAATPSLALTAASLRAIAEEMDG